MNFVPVQFYNENVFEFDGFVKVLDRPMHHEPVIKPHVLEWLLENVGEPHFIANDFGIATTTWRGAVLQALKPDHSPKHRSPLWDVYSKEYRFIFADPDKALLFKLTWV